MDEPFNITLLLTRAAGGDGEARNELYELVRSELGKIADAKMRHERPGHSLQATMLVNDAFLKLVGDTTNLDFQDRKHFYCTAANVMRQILIDHSRRRRLPLVQVDALEIAESRGQDESVQREEDATALSDAIDRLESLDNRLADVIKLRYYAGRTIDETAELLQVSRGTVKNDWRAARAWLHREIRIDG